jgi:sulfate adenylyltransferase
VLELLRARGREATVLDGDEIRASLSADLGFSKTDRDTNVLRAATLAAWRVERGEVVLCALVSPYRAARARAREAIGGDRFIEVLVDAPLHVCEARDTKGLYARARRGELTGLTGVDDPYEAPLEADLVLNAASCTIAHNADRVLRLLIERGFVPSGR